MDKNLSVVQFYENLERLQKGIAFQMKCDKNMEESKQVFDAFINKHNLSRAEATLLCDFFIKLNEEFLEYKFTQDTFEMLWTHIKSKIAD